jgi:hypothetical protein
MPLKAGTKKITPAPDPDPYAESMAEAMERAFFREWRGSMGGQDPPPPNDQMRLMFIAISQGVVNHLRAHPEAFMVTVAEDESGNLIGKISSIETS